MHINFQMIVLMGMAAISCMLGVSILQGKLRGPGANTVSVMMLTSSLWLLAFAFEIGSPSFGSNLFWDVIAFSTTIVLPVVWLIFVLQFSGREEFVNKGNLIIFSIIPVINLLLKVVDADFFARPQIKGCPELKRIPVIVLTTSKSEEDIIKSYDLQANCYITKPVDLDQFVAIVQSIEHFWLSIVRLPEGS